MLNKRKINQPLVVLLASFCYITIIFVILSLINAVFFNILFNMSLSKVLFIIVLFFIPQYIQAQLGETFDIERPEKYTERKIGYEKTYTKKFKLPRRFIQNTVSHYNFFFNANEKLKSVVARAKETQKDTFDRLLNYYSYNLNDTKLQKTDLDSVIEKASSGILIHDLRTNWVDNFYLLIGKAYLLRQDYDSAEMTFNYINYEYAPKTKDKERIVTGSRDNDLNGNNVFSIATKEKRNVKTVLFERPPSRNESFLWMIRSFIENKDYGSAAGLVQTLRNDPIFPKRLHNDLDELTGYLFYKQQTYDSAAHYLAQSLSMADGKNDKSRREFLAGQLYELANNPTQASEFYAKSVKHTLDPVMEVYARLNSIKVKKSDDPKVVDENIAALVKMARKDAYAEYRDIIYYFAGKMALEKKGSEEAKTYFLKSTKYASNNILQKNKSFLALADLSYQEKKYRAASNYYDSIGLGTLTITEAESITSRKDVLKKLVTHIENVETEDSLQLVAAMNTNDRDDYLKKLLRKLRKEQGLKDDGNFGTGGNNGFNNNAPVNLFEPASGEWYFYNNSVKSRGFNEFKNKWGTRPNVDGWRRSANLTANPAAPIRTAVSNATQANSKKQVTDLSLDGLMANLPLTDSLVKLSNDTIQASLLSIAKIYQYDLEDSKLAIEAYETLLRRFPNNPKLDEVYYNVYLAYKKMGNDVEAEKVKKVMEAKFKNTSFLNKINTPTKDKTDHATKTYNEVYNLFIEGNFEAAIIKKKEADSLHGNMNWTPQLLYIEAIYYIKQRNDSVALLKLDNIISQYSQTPIGLKADKLKEVLQQRNRIESELRALQVTRAEEAPIVVTPTVPTPTNPTATTPTTTPAVTTPTVTTQPTTTPPPVVTPKPTVVVTATTTKPKDTVATKPTKPVAPKYIYKHDPTKQHYVAIVLNKVDNIFTNEARNSFVIYNRSTGKSLQVNPVPIDADNKILLIGPFLNADEALQYTAAAQPKIPTEITPWLAKEKYSVIMITEENFSLLQGNKDITTYKNFLNELYPNKFQ
jgi:outer membrane protein assembly factor BamD (BamD/ComL family)